MGITKQLLFNDFRGIFGSIWKLYLKIGNFGNYCFYIFVFWEIFGNYWKPLFFGTYDIWKTFGIYLNFWEICKLLEHFGNYRKLFDILDFRGRFWAISGVWGALGARSNNF